MHNIFYQVVVAVTQFIQKETSVASQNNTRQFKVKLFPAICNYFHIASGKEFH